MNGHLSILQNARNFDEKTRKKALSANSYLTDKNFLSSASFILDLQEILSWYSRYFQKRAYTIIGQLQSRQKLIEALQRLKDHGAGRWTQNLLTTAKCQRFRRNWLGERVTIGNEENCAEIAQYEQDDVDVKYFGQKLSGEGEFEPLSDFLDDLMTRLLENVKRYLPEVVGFVCY